MTTAYVQFSDDTKTLVVGEFYGGPQPAEYFPHQGELDVTDEKYVAYRKIIEGVGFAGIPEL